MNQSGILSFLVPVIIISGISCAQPETGPELFQSPDSLSSTRVRIEDTISDATLSARNNSIRQLTFTDLLQCMPEDVDGYTVSEPINGENGAFGKSGARYFSFASKTFSNKDKKVRVEIIDYTPDTLQYQGLLNMYGFNKDIDNNTLRSKKIDLKIPGTKAITSHYKKEKTAQLIIGTADRVLVVITGMQVQDMDLLQKVARKIDFKRLVEEATRKV